MTYDLPAICEKLCGEPVGLASRTNFLIDAGGRNRVSQVTTLGDYKHHFGVQSLLMDTALVGTGSMALDATIPAMVMTTTNAGDAVIHQSKQWHNYQSGKSQQIEETYIDFGLQTNIIKRFGYFSSNTTTPFDGNFDGFYLESNGLVNDYYQIVMKDGVQVTAKARNDWYDKLDGTGISGIDVGDWNNFNVAAFDFLWLGGTDFTFWHKGDNSFYLGNVYNHAGHSPAPAILSPNQPVRYEIRQVGTGSGTFGMICATVSSEGATNLLGVTQNIGTDTATVKGTTGAYYAISGYSLKPTVRGETALVREVNLIETSGPNNPYFWQLRLNPTVVGTFNYVDKANSNLQEAIGDTTASPSTNTVTGGIVLKGGYGYGRTDISNIIESALRPGSTIAGVMDKIVLCYSPMSANQTLAGCMSILEIL